MPITYEVHNNGHFIVAVTRGKVTCDEFIEFEIAHAIDNRIHSPVTEMLFIEQAALEHISLDDMHRVLDRRAEIAKKPTPHRCGIIIQPGDSQAWKLAKFYEGMVMLHAPEEVIVFGDKDIARLWLGIDQSSVELPFDPQASPMETL